MNDNTPDNTETFESVAEEVAGVELARDSDAVSEGASKASEADQRHADNASVGHHHRDWVGDEPPSAIYTTLGGNTQIHRWLIAIAGIVWVIFLINLIVSFLPGR